MKTIIFPFFCIFAASLTYGQVIQIPGDYPTIQQGIDAATPGDTVLVADGLYYENISLLGKKPLLVTSLYAMDSDTNHINNTIIDGSQFSDIDNASVVAFKSGEDTTSILCGFTIRGGKGTWDSVRNNRCGGGIYISGSGAKIVHNKITENIVDDTQPGNGQETYGGGIGTSHEDADFWVVIDHNQIYNNSAVTKYGWTGGGGIYDSYNTRVTENLITGNHCLATTNGWASGGGFSTVDLEGGLSNTLIIRNNRFYKNRAESVLFLGVDGAASTVNAHLTFTGNEVIDNTGITGVDWGGGNGGLSVINPASGCIVTGNIFRENHGMIDGGAICLENAQESLNPELVVISDNYFLYNEGTFGGAVRSNGIPVLFENNVFNGNKAAMTGGAICAVKWVDYPDDHLITLINNSFAGNFAQLYGGAIRSDSSMLLIVNCVFYRDSTTSGNWEEIYQLGDLDTLDLANCIIDQSQIRGSIHDGGGNFYSDPVFNDQDLLTPGNGSPCRDAGIASYFCHHGYTHSSPDHDLLGITRPLGEFTDIGAYEMMPQAVEDPLSKESSYRFQFRPNPVYDQTVISYELDYDTPVMINLYNSYGSLITHLLEETQQQGSHTLVFDTGNIPAGIYFWHFKVGNKSSAGKMIVVK